MDTMTVSEKIAKNSVPLDEVLIKFSVLGRYHFRLICLIFFAYITNSMYCMNYVFVAESVDFRCKPPPNYCEQGNETDYLLNRCLISIPKNDGQSCGEQSNLQTVQCTEFTYDRTDSFVAEFQLACQEWKRTLIGTIHSFGYMVGLLLVGPTSDRIGRKKTLIVTGCLGAIIGLTRSYFSNYWLYVAFEFLEGAIGDSCSPIFMLAMECTSTQKRALFYMLADFGFPTGGMLMALIAWAVPYWRNFLRVIYAPSFLFLLYFYLIDESPRWLLARGEKDKAIKILEKAAKVNKLELNNDLLPNLQSEDMKQGTVRLPKLLRDTFSSRIILSRFLICVVWWITSTFSNYGMMIGSVELYGNKYINFFLSSTMDVPASLFMGFILTRFKRKIPLFMSFLAGAVFCFAQPFMPSGMHWLSVVLFMAAKLVSTLYFSITYVFTSELFPTYTRNSMHALCSSLGRIGSILAPQTPLLTQYWTGLPSILFGGMAFIAAMLTLLVPDTANESLPDTVTQAEAVGNKKTVDVIPLS